MVLVLFQIGFKISIILDSGISTFANPDLLKFGPITLNQVLYKPLDKHTQTEKTCYPVPSCTARVLFLFLFFSKPCPFTCSSWSVDFILQIHETRIQKQEEIGGELLGVCCKTGGHGPSLLAATFFGYRGLHPYIDPHPPAEAEELQLLEHQQKQGIKCHLKTLLSAGLEVLHR
ncbi:hypothetical protein GHT09_011340 [Marmota monax]|uniref:Uncharacterized protein n=1 Tax=Marmota monax TaxID=9995 RepID=A0A834PNF0_MARMO|nr:hypothetical protein GHT09_011340 [Marmota monax]